jgi:hypothetical protein
LPPAWAAGEPVPWPSQAEVREERRAAMQRGRGGEPERAPVAATPPRTDRPHNAASKKKKRKRRS